MKRLEDAADRIAREHYGEDMEVLVKISDIDRNGYRREGWAGLFTFSPCGMFRRLQFEGPVAEVYEVRKLITKDHRGAPDEE